MIHSEPIKSSAPLAEYRTRSLTRGLPLVLAAALLLAVTACSSLPPPPTQQLQAAELAITNAEQARVADYASAELNQARQKLAAAHTAVQNEDMPLAQRLADESRVSAELATAKTEMLEARAVNEEMQQSIDTLKQEMLRNSGTLR
jgi:hypothetical protein